MKRYFNNMSEKQVIKLECSDYSVLAAQEIPSIFGDICEVVEITKTEYLRLEGSYRRTNETSFSITISR